MMTVRAATAQKLKKETKQASFQRIRTAERLFLDVVRQIEKRIVEKDLKPGDMLPAERIMAEQFGVSRTVIREAMKTLELRGLVEVQHGRGVMVVSPSVDNIADSVVRFFKIQRSPIWSLHELRSILEVEFAGLAAERRTEENVADLSDLLVRMSAAMDAPSEYVELDFQFHRALAKAAQNPLFSFVLEPYAAVTREARRLGATARNAPRRSIEMHKRIFEAIKNRKPEEARRAMRNHFAHVATFIAEAESQTTARR